MKHLNPTAAAAVPEEVKPKTDIELYEGTYLPKFLDIIKNLDQTTEQKYNTNIEPILYTRKELLELLKDPKNPYEEKWRKNILYETTPRGNIVMYYDIFKQGFTYYSDHTMTYTILNTAAMKYCLYFSCLDFFMDDHILNDRVSPFTRLLLEEEKTEADKKKENIKQMIPNISNARFAKLKNYSAQPSTQENPDQTQEKLVKTEKPKELMINKFINLGKISNFSFIQKTVKPSPIINSKPTMFDEMFSDVKIANKEVLNYKKFKENQLKLKLESSLMTRNETDSSTKED
jgi:hypothetical protein